MVLTKRLFNFTCDSIKALVGSNFNVEYDKKIGRILKSLAPLKVI